MRSHITPAKKRSSFTSETCSTVEGHTHIQDMSENKGTGLVSRLSLLSLKDVHCFKHANGVSFLSSAAVTMRTYLRAMTALWVTAPF